ncbi:MAG: 30S ribosome-binding factor RbfA [Clostridiales bacterium]|nr:30S ribosome-binding factor RbfA [Clostridiales bacterium]MCF8022181.1 30S ribosome-binding factor RbfA [Clostridiales bacterium]
MSRRPERLAVRIKQEISDMLTSDLKDPRVGFATITRVDVSADLRHAKIYVSVMGKEDEQNTTIDALQKAKGFVRTELGNRIRLRYVPEIYFIHDQSMDYGMKIMDLIDKVNKEDKGEKVDE